MRQKTPLWWRDIDRSIRLGIADYEFIIARLEMMLVGAKFSKLSRLNSRRWENLLEEAKLTEKRIARSLVLAAARRRDASAIGLIPPSSQELAAKARAASAKFHVLDGLAQGRMTRIRDELRRLGRPRKRPSMGASPSQIDLHI